MLKLSENGISVVVLKESHQEKAFIPEFKV